MKGKHGGAGRGQGRKPMLTPVQMIDVGETYDRLWQEASVIDAYAKYYADENNWAAEKRIAQLQDENQNPPKHLARHRQALEQRRHIRGKEIDKLVLSIKPRGKTLLVRAVSLPLKARKDRVEIVTEITIQWCQWKYHIPITRRLVAECRLKHRQVKKQMRQYWPKT
jgi:hypothetical protein